MSCGRALEIDVGGGAAILSRAVTFNAQGHFNDDSGDVLAVETSSDSVQPNNANANRIYNSTGCSYVHQNIRGKVVRNFQLQPMGNSTCK